MLHSGKRVLGGSSTCWWKHNLMRILVLYFFPEHLLLVGAECEGKRNPVGSTMALLMSS